MRISVLIPNSNNQEMQIKLEFIKRNVKAGLATVGEFPCFTRGWAAETMQESFALHILGVGRLREDQFIYAETRETCFS